MRMINPTSGIKIMDVLNSIYKVFSGGVSFGSASSFDNSGNGILFNADNISGALIRVGPTANPLALENSWAASNANTTITHNLNRRPIGYLVMNKNKTCDVYSSPSLNATNTTIILSITDATADTLLFIF